MKPCRMQNQISLYLDGELNGEALRRFEDHLQNCEGCRTEVEQMSDLLRALRTLPEREVPAGLTDRLHAALAQEATKGTVRMKRKFNPWIAAPVAAALVVFVAGGALLLNNRQSPMRYDVAPAPENRLMDMAGAPDEGARDGANYGVAEAVPQATAAAEAISPEEPTTAENDNYTTSNKTNSLTGGGDAGNRTGLQSNALLNAQSGRKMIYTANLQLETREFDKSLAGVNDILARYNGYVEQNQVSGVPEGKTGGRSASFTLRFPIANYDKAMGDLAALGNLLSRTESTEDVSRQYVDTEARNKTLTLQRDRLYELLAKADKMENIISLENEITRLTTEIEQMSAQLRFWDDKVSYSSVSINLRELVTPPQSVIPPDPDLNTRRSGAFYDTLNSMREGFEEFTVRFMGALPWLIIVIVAAGIALGVAIPLIRRAARARRNDTSKEE